MVEQVAVAALGNAIVDVLAHVEEPFLAEHGIVKGGMALIDTAAAEKITGALSDTSMVAGGSAANTAACMASLGSSVRFIGKVAGDELGAVFTQSMRAVGVRYDTPPLEGPVPTGRCVVAVTPDAERSMSTFLGASAQLGPKDVMDEEVGAARVLYLEGYLMEGDLTFAACRKAAQAARASAGIVALSLADEGLVGRQRDALLAFIDEYVDLVFANEAEAKALTGGATAEDAAGSLRSMTDYGAVTMSERGSIVFGPDGPAERVEAMAPPQLVDTTGAGDAYAAGFLHGLTTNESLAKCGAYGALAASEIISHMGPRPQKTLSVLAREAGL